MIWQRLSMLIAPVVILLLFGPSLIGKETLAFRDVSHFYLPLYDYVAQRTSDQWLPLWNPLDQTGMPLLGESTTAVLYPIRYIVFGLPLDTDVAMVIYIVLHLILGSWAARYAAVQAGVSPLAATVSGIAYPLSGSVLFLYTNPPFLVGAAWLPFALSVLISTKEKSAVSRTVIAGVSMAMAILGGDPQLALHVMMVAGAVWSIRLIRHRVRPPRKIWEQQLRCLLFAPALAAALSCPQLCASLSWSSRSDRVADEQKQDWRSPPAAKTHRFDVYQFSLPPWHAAELVSGNAFGRLFPLNARLSQLIPGDGRMWTPSIYCGLLSLLALVAFSAPSHHSRGCWYWIALASLTLSIGHFGLIWVVQQAGMARGWDSAIGGPYWWLSTFFPGYDSFRYPTKWLPFFSLAASVMVGKWIDGPGAYQRSKMAFMTVSALLGLGLLAWGVSMLYINELALRADGQVDELWGPLNISVALEQIRNSLVASIVTIAILALVLRLLRNTSPGTRVAVLMAILTGDLAYQNGGLVRTVSTNDLRSLQASADETKTDGRFWLRTKAHSEWPRSWRDSGDRSRMLYAAASERLSWFGRWHLQDRQHVLNNMVSIRSNDMAMFWLATKRLTGHTQTPYLERWRRIRAWLGITGIAQVQTERISESSVSSLIRVPTEDAGDVFFASSWVVSQTQSQTDFDALMRRIVNSPTRPVPLIHGFGEAPLAEEKLSGVPSAVKGETPYRVRAKDHGFLIRSVYQDGHWKGFVRKKGETGWREISVYPVSFLKQGVRLGPGEWEVRFTYAPWWLTGSCVIALTAWFGTLVVIYRRRLA